MRCYLTKTGCVDRLLELGAHLSLIRGPHTLHYCPRCSAGVNSLTYKKLIWSYLEMCSKKNAAAWLKTCVEGTDHVSSCEGFQKWTCINSTATVPRCGCERGGLLFWWKWKKTSFLSLSRVFNQGNRSSPAWLSEAFPKTALYFPLK